MYSAIKTFIKNYFLSFGIASLLLLILTHFDNLESRFHLYLSISAIWCLLATVINAIILRTEVDSRELWIRRIIAYSLTAITGLITATIIIAFQHKDTAHLVNQHELLKLLAVFIGLYACAFIFIAVPLYIFADRLEKKKLEKINIQLKENENNQ